MKSRTFQYRAVAHRLLADTVTPVGLYLRLRDSHPYSLLLESADSRGDENSFSFICFDQIASFELREGTVRECLPDGGTTERQVGGRTELFDAFENFRNSFAVTAERSHPPVQGLFGFTSYDAIEYFEDIKLTAEQVQSSDVPRMRYGFYRAVIAINHFKDELFLIEHLAPGEEPRYGAAFLETLSRRPAPEYPFRLTGSEQSNFDDAGHAEMVRLCKTHIARGDVFQIVPSRRFQQSFEGDEFNVYRALRSINPSPYLFYFDYGDYRIFGSSPEAQILIKSGKATIYPIAGTYRRTGDEKADSTLAEALKADPKESAEHVMLVDLARNDLSRHCTGVRVEAFKEVHFYSHVIHLVSKVSGELRQEMNPLAVLADSFPAGTLSGAPKYRAMELIDRYERGRRGIYGGCLGFFGFNGDCTHAIVIRSFLSRDNVLYSQTGGGVVFDSVEEGEVQEVRNKRGALMGALQIAEKISQREAY